MHGTGEGFEVVFSTLISLLMIPRLYERGSRIFRKYTCPSDDVRAIGPENEII